MTRTPKGKLREHQKSKTCIWHLQLPLSLVRPSERFNSCKSIFICSSQVFLGLPRLLLPSIIMLSTLLTGVTKVFLCTCPKHLNLFSRIFPEIRLPLVCRKLLIPNSIHQCMSTHPPQHTHFCSFHLMFKNLL